MKKLKQIILSSSSHPSPTRYYSWILTETPAPVPPKDTAHSVASAPKVRNRVNNRKFRKKS